MNLLQFITDPKSRELFLEFGRERVLPFMGGVGLVIVGLVFFVSGSKIASAAGDIAEDAVGTRIGL